MRGVDPASPDDGLPDSAALELIAYCLAWRLRQRRRAVEPAQPLPHQRFNDPRPVMPGVLGKIRVVRGHQRHVPTYRVAPSGQAKGTLGGHVNDIRLERVEKPRHRPELRQGQANGGIRRERSRWHAQLSGYGCSAVSGIARGNDDDFMAKRANRLHDPRDHCRDAVDLRRVSVGYQCNSHESHDCRSKSMVCDVCVTTV